MAKADPYAELRSAEKKTGTTAAPRRPIAGFIIRHAMRIIGLPPLRVIHLAAGAMGWAAARLPLQARRIAEANLRLAFPELSTAERSRLLRKAMPQVGRTLLELCALWSRKPERVLQLVRGTSGEEAMRQAIAEGRGVILAGLHLGPWELVLAHCAAHYPMTTLYRPLRLREQDRHLRAARERFGATMVPTGTDAVRRLRRALGRGEMTGIAPDQDAGDGGRVFAPFFGVTANTMTLLPRLAARTRALVVFAFGERLPRGAGYRLHFVSASEAVYDRDPDVSAAAMNRDIEQCIRRFPDHYLWTYKRFRVRPPGVEDPYRKRGRFPAGDLPPQAGSS